jgi:putative tryptophan/tyrosine transport system substrate-binding protein
MQKIMNSKNLVILIIFLVLAVGAAFLFYSLFSAPKMVTVGISRWATNSEFDRSVVGFKQGLAKKGYIEGENIQFIEMNPEADLDDQRTIIEEFIEKDVDLIFSLTTPGTLIAKEITEKMETPTPVVFSVCTFPVESKLIASLDSSENHLVGTRNYVPFAQQYYVFEQLLPQTKSLAVVRRVDEPNSENQLKEVRLHLKGRNISIIDIAAVDLDDIKQQLVENTANIDAVFSTCDTLTHNGGEEIIAEFALSHKIPSFACNKEGVTKGLLVGNIGDFNAIAEISGEQAAQILDGASPSWLKTESPRDNYIVLNENTANALNVTLSPQFRDTVKEIIK